MVPFGVRSETPSAPTVPVASTHGYRSGRPSWQSSSTSCPSAASPSATLAVKTFEPVPSSSHPCHIRTRIRGSLLALLIVPWERFRGPILGSPATVRWILRAPSVLHRHKVSGDAQASAAATDGIAHHLGRHGGSERASDRSRWSIPARVRSDRLPRGNAPTSVRPVGRG